MSTEEKQKQLKADIQAFIQNNLSHLCQEILHWRKKSKLPEGGKFHVLAEMHAQTRPEETRDDDSYQLAERLVTIAALEAAAATKTHEPEQPSGQ